MKRNSFDNDQRKDPTTKQNEVFIRTAVARDGACSNRFLDNNLVQENALLVSANQTTYTDSAVAEGEGAIANVISSGVNVSVVEATLGTLYAKSKKEDAKAEKVEEEELTDMELDEPSSPYSPK